MATVNVILGLPRVTLILVSATGPNCNSFEENMNK